MLRRDVEYVLTWDEPAHAWLARPVKYQDGLIVRAGPECIEVDIVAWGAGPWSSERDR
jgi:hypothetical protein